MKSLTAYLILILSFSSFAQIKETKTYGFRHLVINYQSDIVDVLIKSKEGEENIKKPLFLFCQGSLPQPLLKLDKETVFSVFPFNTDNLLKEYNLIIISKPYIPLVVDIKQLGNNYTYIDSEGKTPKEYNDRNLLSYYTERNLFVLKQLQKLDWVSNKQLIVAGHSEGSTVAANMANQSKMITHLIYSSGNPMGRMLSIIQQDRAQEKDSENLRFAEEDFKYWEAIAADKDNKDATEGDSFKTTYEFSIPSMDYLNKLKIPVLVCYGTKDWSAPYNDLLRVDCIRKNKTNFQFNAYIGTDHNFFPLKEDHTPNYAIYNWDKVAEDWVKWLREF